MKIITLIFALIFLNLSVRGQNIDVENIQIKNTLNHSIYYGVSPEELQKAFGKAVITKPKDKSAMSEMTGKYYYFYKYDGFEACFESDELESKDLSNNSITISNSKYRLFLNGVPYKVRDNINNLIKHFPDAFKDREVNPDPERQQMFISVNDSDVNICIDYNKHGFKTEMGIYFNES